MIKLLQGHTLDVLKTLQAQSVHCAVTSPPFYGLRNYGTDGLDWPAVSYAPMPGLPEIHIVGCEDGCEHVWGELQPCHHPGQVEQTKWKNADGAGKGQTAGSGQFCQRCGGWRGSLGLEPNIDMFVGHLVLIFRELHRVLRNDSTTFLNLGDSFKDKQLLGIPWRVAFALQADGWYLRSDIIWHKKNPMPESVTDRPTKAHEYLFLLAKGKRYFYDQVAVREVAQYGRRKWSDVEANLASVTTGNDKRKNHGIRARASVTGGEPSQGRNRRSVWTLSSEPVKQAHFATFPTKLVEPCILAGTSEAGVCSICKTPYIRVTQKTGKTKRQQMDEAGMSAYGGTNGNALNYKGGHTLPERETKTTGWQPQCACQDEHGEPPPTVPATVLDIFSGSGTTGLVAKELGRDYIGIELNPEYIELARKRINTAQPRLFATGDSEAMPTEKQLGF